MQKTINQFATVTKNGVIQKIGRSQILTPKTNYQGGKMKYFDDSKLLKKNHEQVTEKADLKGKYKEILTMKNRTMTTNIGTINLADLTLADDTFCIFIPIVEISDGLKATVEENIQKAKDEWQRECLDERGKKWSDKGINVITQDLRITVGEKRGKKVFDCDLSYTFEDAENPVIWHGFSLEVDLSEHIAELKSLIIKAMVDKFFK